MSNNQAAVLQEEKANLTIEKLPIPKPGPSDVVVKNSAIATNPVDWKMQQFGFIVEKYPTILGSDVSGVVDAVGSDVKHFQKGDRVTGFADALLSKDPRNGAFQQYSVVKECALARIPDFMSFEEGSILPMVRLLQPIFPLFKQIGSPETLSRDSRAPPESTIADLEKYNRASQHLPLACSFQWKFLARLLSNRVASWSGVHHLQSVQLLCRSLFHLATIPSTVYAVLATALWSRSSALMRRSTTIHLL